MLEYVTYLQDEVYRIPDGLPIKNSDGETIGTVISSELVNGQWVCKMKIEDNIDIMEDKHKNISVGHRHG